MYENTLSAADIAAVTRNNESNGMFGNGNDAWWIIVLLLFGWGRNGFGGYGSNNGTCAPCATQADVRAAVDQQTLISKLDQQTYGLADSTYALNNTINQNFRGVDNAICTLGYQSAQHASDLAAQIASCCCDLRGAVKDVGTQSVMNTNAIQQQISSCCCDIEKMNLQNRFDNQTYNCNTLQAIDKLGDRIINYMVADKTQALRDENQALRLAASQSAQNQYIINALRPMPVPAYASCNPWAASYGYNCNNGCGCNTGCNNGCGGF